MQAIDSIKKNQTLPKLFSQLCINENINLLNNMPDIEQLISCVTDSEIISIKTINTMSGLSYEGQYLTGKKVVIDFILKQKILYVTTSNTESVYVLENELYQSAYIVIPCKIEGTDPEYLIKNQYLKPKIVLENINCCQIDKRNIFDSISMMIHLDIIPTYELCYSLQKDNTSSNVFMMKESHNILVNQDLPNKCIRPKWSPNGKEIAFLSKVSDQWRLYLYSLKTKTVRQITDSKYFKSITGFSWSVDSLKLYFTVFDGQLKEIYMIETDNLCYQQLTYSENIGSSYNPKCAPDGKQLGFIRSSLHSNDLWIINTDGSGCQQLTVTGNIKGFDWSNDSIHIGFFTSFEHNAENNIYIINSQNKSIFSIDCGENRILKKKIKYSFDGQYLAFIGCDYQVENIYIYSILENTLHNITGYTTNIQIYDFTWNADGYKIYYSASNLNNYNIFSVEIHTYLKTQHTFFTSSYIELDYRPRIF